MYAFLNFVEFKTGHKNLMDINWKGINFVLSLGKKKRYDVAVIEPEKEPRV